MYPTNVISMVSCNAQRLDIWSPRKYGRNNLCHNICNLHYYVYFYNEKLQGIKCC